jgi:hypothetical protein
MTGQRFGDLVAVRPIERAKKTVRERLRRHTRPETLASKREIERRYRVANKRKNAVHVTLFKAIKSGKLVRGSCEACGAVEVEGHHDDYAQPLQVRWLCHVHHKSWHKENGEGANAHV